MEELHRHFVEQIEIDPSRIPIVVLSAVVIYLFFLILVRTFGVRVMSKMTAFDTVVLIMFGAVAGRVIIGHPPTLAAGAIGLVTLMLLEAALGAARKQSGLRRVFDEKPHAVFAHGQYLDKQMRHYHISKSDMRMVMRRAGIHHRNQVQLIVLEPTGEMSLFRAGEPLERELFKGVQGIPDSFWADA
ncbi:DUF421 domain-containing protein [Corynebacterium sp. 320]|uniref:DUF421 domain-containing protein n=1 Tax=Corynebacterium TaxID=1716 RepID=UPI00125CAF35|nr:MULTISPECIES: YetF domain-containing protein [Corynebacterium]KAB1502561.1 DUF421 domain-containing protein [Corynebacterium sp. 320]KAB1551217.1 DUF421 domain-containing protein [Corynebacterium sp. 321]KAB1551954.1 DUF421 domain-containing protein [Corynebacterium sp. 319]KAB3526168.1 DUF421 domain-containing protein [Corynebacterium sp. 250]KAB3538948.1 DUF421 domain-containing protein [Corynebacterium sp. 366]